MLNPYIYQIGETVVLSVEIKNPSTNIYVDPDTATIQIYSPSGSVLIDGTIMTKESIGKYYYDFTPGTADPVGKYTVIYTAQTGSRIAKRKDHFNVEA